MCGIVGYVGNFKRSSLDLALESIKKRGPDDFGTFYNSIGDVGLGHTRLSIIDTSKLGHQPMVSEDKSVVLVYNGEIYNYRELRVDLEDSGYSFNGHSDTEVLMKMYLKHRDSIDDFRTMLHCLNGIFAFAIWDIERGSLLLARDALGVKPIYYVENSCGFAFGSELNTVVPFLIEGGDFAVNNKCAIDVAAINRYLTFLWCPGEGTPFKAVRKLGPGEGMWIVNGQVKKRWSWYNLPAFRMKTLLLTEQESVSGTTLHLRKAVQRQMVADVPVGAFLSGGLDSSSIVAFARELNPDIHCFTIEAIGSNDDGFPDDLPYARRVAEYLKVPLEVIKIDSSRFLQNLDVMIEQLGEPLADPATLNVLFISQFARQQGIKVLLSGAGGDDLFTGYRRHRALMTESVWSWLPRRGRECLDKMARRLNQHPPFFRRLRKLFNGAGLDGDARLINYFRWADRDDINSLYTSEFREMLHNENAEDPMAKFLGDLPLETTRLERMLALEQRFFLSDHNLAYTDRMSMAVGVEVRVPFLDLDLVDFAAQIPTNLKQRGSEGKWVLKKAMEPYLPREVIYRSKSGFGAPLRRWIKGEMRELIGDILGGQSLRRRGLFDPNAVQRLIHANNVGDIDGSYTILSLVCIELWCRRFLDGRISDSRVVFG